MKRLLLCCICFFCLTGWAQADNLFANMGTDFTAYWSSVRLLINGDNPYLNDKIFALEKSVGWTEDKPLVMYNPPWVMTFILPFSSENYLLAKAIWFLFLFICIFFCTDWLWRFYGGGDEGRYLPLLILSCYPPIYLALVKCQIVPLILLGIMGFLHFERQHKWFLAGMFLCLLGIKPQVLYLFFIALLFWIIYKRQWKVVSGAGCVTFLITAIPLLYNPDIFQQYYKEVVAHSYQYYWETPTWGSVLRDLFGKEKILLQYFPTILGTAWFFHYWHENYRKWIWAEQTPLLIFMSLMTTFYVWHNDYILILVPIIQASVWLQRKSISYSKYMILTYATIIVLAWVTIFSVGSEKWIVWMIPALFINYLLLRKYQLKTNATNKVTA